MRFDSLENVSVERIVGCLIKAFEGYFVTMPSDVDFWKNRFENASVDRSLSWGVFDADRLVAFVINAIDYESGRLTAFNTGTGVLQAYRGNQLVDKMYEYGLSALKNKGVQRCSLEVIDKNEKAINVYKRIGFSLNHKLFCYEGVLDNHKNVMIREVKLKDIEHYPTDDHYSWDNRRETVRKVGKTYSIYQVDADNGMSSGYFIINPENGYIAQLESDDGNWDAVFSGISQIQKNIKINNVREDRVGLLAYLNKNNFQNTINQFDMEMNF